MKLTAIADVPVTYSVCEILGFCCCSKTEPVDGQFGHGNVICSRLNCMRFNRVRISTSGHQRGKCNLNNFEIFKFCKLVVIDSRLLRNQTCCRYRDLQRSKFIPDAFSYPILNLSYVSQGFSTKCYLLENKKVMKQDLPASGLIISNFLPFLFPNFGLSLDILCLPPF